jgi:hypothetical protein
VLSIHNFLDIMKVSVFDIYVERRDERVMHFDILVPESEQVLEKIYGFGQQFLASKGQEGQNLNTRECKFCHIEEATPEVIASIESDGFYIVEMENCD